MLKILQTLLARLCGKTERRNTENKKQKTISDLISACAEMVSCDDRMVIHCGNRLGIYHVYSGARVVFTLEPQRGNFYVLYIYDSDVRNRPSEYVIGQDSPDYKKILKLLSLCRDKQKSQQEIEDVEMRLNAQKKLNADIQRVLGCRHK